MMSLDIALSTLAFSFALIALAAGAARLVWLFAAPYATPVDPEATRTSLLRRSRLIALVFGGAIVGGGVFYAVVLVLKSDAVPGFVKLIAYLGFVIGAPIIWVPIGAAVSAQDSLVRGIGTPVAGTTRDNRLSVRRANLWEIAILLSFAFVVLICASFKLPDASSPLLLSPSALGSRLRLDHGIAEWAEYAGIIMLALNLSKHMTARSGYVFGAMAVPIVGGVANAIYASAVPSSWAIERFAKNRSYDAADRQDFLIRYMHAEALAIIGLALILTIVLAPLLDRLADRVRLANRDIGIYRASWFAVAAGILIAAYLRMWDQSVDRYYLWILAGASFSGIAVSVIAGRICEALRQLAREATGIIDFIKKQHWLVLLAVVVLVPSILWGASRIPAYWASGFLLGAFGAVAAGASKGRQQAAEAEEIEQITAFE